MLWECSLVLSTLQDQAMITVAGHRVCTRSHCGVFVLNYKCSASVIFWSLHLHLATLWSPTVGFHGSFLKPICTALLLLIAIPLGLLDRPCELGNSDYLSESTEPEESGGSLPSAPEERFPALVPVGGEKEILSCQGLGQARSLAHIVRVKCWARGTVTHFLSSCLP